MKSILSHIVFWSMRRSDFVSEWWRHSIDLGGGGRRVASLPRSAVGQRATKALLGWQMGHVSIGRFDLYPCPLRFGFQ